MTPKIFVFCNNCSPGWHVFEALSEDGVFLASHVCSAHGWAAHDMGINPDGWKRDVYARYYPEGFEVILVEDPKNDLGVKDAYARHRAMSEGEYAIATTRAYPKALPQGG